MLLTSLYPHRRYPASAGFGARLPADFDQATAPTLTRSMDGAAGSRNDAAPKGSLAFTHPRLSLAERQRLERFYLLRRTRPFYVALAGEARLCAFARPPKMALQPGQRFTVDVDLVEV